MRAAGSRKGVPSAYPRQLESLIRLAEAHARVHLREWVNEDDVEEAHRLYREALKQSCLDPLTGRIDIGILTTGISTERQRQLDAMREDMSKFIEEEYVGNGRKAAIPIHVVHDDFTTYMANKHLGGGFVPPAKEDVHNVLRALMDDNQISVKNKMVSVRF